MTLRKFLSTAALALAMLGPWQAQAQLIPAANVYTSSTYGLYGAWNAVDGVADTFWASGVFPPASIDVIFPGEYNISGVQMHGVMWPNNGLMDHVVYGRTIEGGYIFLGEIYNYVANWQWHWLPNPAPAVPYNAVTVYTPWGDGASWVGWRDIYPYGTPYVKPEPVLPPGPRIAGDLVGRNLANTVFGGLGHIGVFDGDWIIQVMNESVVLQQVDWKNFHSKDPVVWPTLNPNIPRHMVWSCFELTCMYLDARNPNENTLEVPAHRAIALRARQILMIGAEYTLTTTAKLAVPYMVDRLFQKNYPKEIGMYRCDTVVIDAYGYSHYQGSYLHYGRSYIVPKRTTGESSIWASHMTGLMAPALLTPSAIYDRIRSF